MGVFSGLLGLWCILGRADERKLPSPPASASSAGASSPSAAASLNNDVKGQANSQGNVGSFPSPSSSVSSASSSSSSSLQAASVPSIPQGFFNRLIAQMALIASNEYNYCSNLSANN